MKGKLFLVLLALGLALSAGLGIARADGGVSFGIRPTQASPDRPATFSYFSYELAPGAVLSDEALVMNSGEVPVTLKLYAADGITAINTGTAFAKQGQESSGASRGVSRWLSLSVTEIALEPGEETVVSFTINVPSDASPGHHVAGLVVGAPPSGEASPGGAGEPQFAVRVVQQSEVAVVIDVPGPHVAGLEITGAGLKQQDDQGATFVIAVRSTGNIFVKGEGSLLISDRNGEELASIPLKMGTVLPGDATSFHVSHPVHLADGSYLLTVVLKYEGKTAILEGVEVKVKDGQPEVPKAGQPSEPGLPRQGLTNLTPADEKGQGYALYGVALLAVIVVGASLLIWRKRRMGKTADSGSQASGE